MDRIALLKELIAKENDPSKLASLQDELLKAVAEKAVAEERARLAAESKKDEAKVEQKSMQDAAKKSTVFPVAGRAQVLSNDSYKGYRLKRETEAFIAKLVTPGAVSRAKAEVGRTEDLLKFWLDVFEKGVQNAGRHVEVEKAAMQEGTDSEGGYLTPIEQREELLGYVRDTSKCLARCTHIPMTSDVMTIPSESTKVSVAYTAEEVAATESEPTFGVVTLTAKRMDAFSIVSNELIQDARVPGGIAGTLLGQFMEAVGQKIDSTVFKDGGTIAAGSGLFLAAGVSEVFSSGSAAFSMILEQNFRNLISKIPSHYLDQPGTAWFVHRTPLYGNIYGLKDSQNRPLFIENYMDGAAGRIWGYPVILSEQAIGTSAASTAMAILANLAGFIIGDRLTTLTLFLDPYTKSKEYQTQFLLFTRWAFANALPNYSGRIVTSS